MVSKAVPYARNDAFAGEYARPSPFRVFYIGRPEARLLMAAAGTVRNPGHPNYIACGWRWQALPDTAEMHGPFSSSSNAYKAAVKVLTAVQVAAT